MIVIKNIIEQFWNIPNNSSKTLPIITKSRGKRKAKEANISAILPIDHFFHLF